MASLNANLSVAGTPVISAYTQFKKGQITVNRKYQRKLVWTTNEKSKFVDSILKSLPIPLILTAEVPGPEGPILEIIDGMQRLNAIFSYIDGEYALEGKFFNKATLGDLEDGVSPGVTKSRELLSNDECVQIISYALPISTYRATNDGDVEEIFRRINSNGRHLSPQEIRQAGSISPIAGLVREVASIFRNDYSLTDLVDLKDMPRISLTDSPDSEGINMSDVFWVKQGILRKEDLRGSKDEEVILDIVTSILFGADTSYDSRKFDAYYGLRGEAALREQVENRIRLMGPETIIERIRFTLDVFNTIFSTPEHSFSTLFFTGRKSKVPRYFECVFLALQSIIFEEGREVFDYLGARDKLDSYGSKFMDIRGGGGTWTGKNKNDNVLQVKGALREFSREAADLDNPLRDQSNQHVLNLLSAAQVEAPLFELKQGLCELSDPPKKKQSLVPEIARTLTAMANKSKQSIGYLIVGVCDDTRAAERIRHLTNEKLSRVSGHYISGLDLDIKIHGSLDEALMWFTNIFKSLDITEAFREQVLSDMRVAKLEGRSLLLLKAKSVGEPVQIEGKFYRRIGSETCEIPATEYSSLFARFQTDA